MEVANPAACMFCNECAPRRSQRLCLPSPVLLPCFLFEILLFICIRCVVHAKLIPDPDTGATKNFIDIVSIEERPNKFLFTVESSGGLPPRAIVMQVCCGKRVSNFERCVAEWSLFVTRRRRRRFARRNARQ